jgi:hypothetical protein
MKTSEAVRSTQWKLWGTSVVRESQNAVGHARTSAPCGSSWRFSATTVFGLRDLSQPLTASGIMMNQAVLDSSQRKELKGSRCVTRIFGI